MPPPLDLNSNSYVMRLIATQPATCPHPLCPLVQLPSPERMSRWLGEPLKAVLLPTCAFRPNKRGYPVLPPAHQELLAKLFAHNVQVRMCPKCVCVLRTPDVNYM